MPDPVKKKKKVQKKPSNMQGRGGGATKNTAIKGTRANTEKAAKKRKKEQYEIYFSFLRFISCNNVN